MTKLASENGSNKANAQGFTAKDAATAATHGAVDPSVKAQAVPAPAKAVAPGKGVAPALKKVLPEQGDEANAVKKHHDDDQSGTVQASEGEAQPLAMVDSASAASVGTIAADGGQDGGATTTSDDSGDGGISAPLIIGGVLLVGGGAALALGGGGKKNVAPVFTSGATATIAENAAATTTVYTATATDANAKDTITYTLSGTDAAAFNISAAGVVTLKASADFETKSSYAITVNASDGKLTTSQNVAVTVTNVNEAPVITSNGGGADAAVNVFENSTVVTTVTSTDVDAGATKTFSISGGADASKFDINATTGALSFKAAPNFENKADADANGVYVVTVRATDNGTPGLTDDQTISVTVADVNEAPTAVVLTGATAIAENSNVTGGVKVGTISVTDDALGTETLSLTGADAASFEIRNGNELFYVGASPNFEVKSSYGVTVNADDTTIGAAGSIEASQTFTINVTDVNEAPTAVVLSNTVTTVAENSVIGAGIKVADIAVTDDALGTEALTLTGADAASFEIRNGTELFYIGGSPNFEANATYDVTVNADDTTIGAAGSVEASQTFTLNVTDVADALVLPTSGTVNAGIQGAGQTDTNFIFTENGDQASNISIDDFTANDVINLTNADPANLGFSRENATDLRIEYSDTGDTNAISVIILRDVFVDAVTPVFDEATARTAMGFGVGVDFFTIA
jgi:hypothetical protein